MVAAIMTQPRERSVTSDSLPRAEGGNDTTVGCRIALEIAPAMAAVPLFIHAEIMICCTFVLLQHEKV